MYLIYILYKVRMLVSLSCAYNMKLQTMYKRQSLDLLEMVLQETGCVH